MPFEPGQSGNPKGRPPGAKDRRAELREKLRSHAPELIQKTVTLALEGDTTALKILWDRMLPVLKPASEPVPLPMVGESLLDQGKEVLQGVQEGRLTVEEALEALTVLKAYGNLTSPEWLLEKHREDKDFDTLLKRAM